MPARFGSGSWTGSSRKGSDVRVDVVTIFPEMFPAAMSASMTGLAQDNGALELAVHDLRAWAHDKHRTTDDYPYGGGPGMVMKPGPLFEALDELTAGDSTPFVVFMAPVGEPFTQARAVELSTRAHLVFVCGRYEGFDERALSRADLCLSVGDYVLTGGELPAMVVIDAVTRLLPGVLGHDQSAVEESFSEGLLEYPQYTRPSSYRGMDVPDVLLSGDHARIARWRREQSIITTARVRPDLLDAAELTPDERALADDARSSGSLDTKGHE